MEKQQKKRNMNAPLPPSGAASVHEKNRLLAGRLGVIAAVLVFVGTYTFGISKYGVVLGIALGWLPCGVAAWLAAITVASVSGHAIPYIIAIRQRLPHLVRLLRSEMQHKN
jgi:hypothetical protein